MQFPEELTKAASQQLFFLPPRAFLSSDLELMTIVISDASGSSVFFLTAAFCVHRGLTFRRSLREVLLVTLFMFILRSVRHFRRRCTPKSSEFTELYVCRCAPWDIFVRKDSGV